MKWLTAMLGLYMTILAVLPCRDKDDTVNTLQQTVVQHSRSAGQGTCRETCPPFCSCTCCSTTRNLTRIFILLPAAEQPVNREYRELRVEPIREQTLPIWQPPQLS